MTHPIIRHMTPWLAFSCFCLLLGDMSYGFDTNSFGGILANPVSSACSSGYGMLFISTSSLSCPGLHQPVW